jgi:Domain of unknown function (DUF4277)
MTLSPSSESTTHLGHYGLIAGAFDELDISDLIDDLLPKKSGHNIPHSTLIKPTFSRSTMEVMIVLGCRFCTFEGNTSDLKLINV